MLRGATLHRARPFVGEKVGGLPRATPGGGRSANPGPNPGTPTLGEACTRALPKASAQRQDGRSRLRASRRPDAACEGLGGWRLGASGDSRRVWARTVTHAVTARSSRARSWGAIDPECGVQLHILYWLDTCYTELGSEAMI